MRLSGSPPPKMSIQVHEAAQASVPVQAPRFAMLADLAKETSSEGRRELLRKVTNALLQGGSGSTDVDHLQLDNILAAIACDYSTRVRAEIAHFIARTRIPISRTARQFSLDEIEVAEPILKHSRALTEVDLLKVIDLKSQNHLLAVTKREDISQTVCHALVERGDDQVVFSLLENEKADIGGTTYETVAVRAGTSNVLQGPFVRRPGVPLELLSDLYLKVEADLRREIMRRFDQISGEEVDKAFLRSRSRISKAYRAIPEDYGAAVQRIEAVERRGELVPPLLVSLLREGQTARTAFKLAFSRLSDVDFELIQMVVEAPDLDALALLCRGAGFERALFVTLAISLDNSLRALAGAEEFGQLYESVPVQAAQRALRFWKVRANA